MFNFRLRLINAHSVRCFLPCLAFLAATLTAFAKPGPMPLGRLPDGATYSSQVEGLYKVIDAESAMELESLASARIIHNEANDILFVAKN